MFRILHPIWLAATLAACANDLPEAQRTVSPRVQAADYPDLAPAGPLLAEAARRPAQSALPDLEARASALRSRADALRAEDVLDPATRRRLETADPG